MSLYYKQTNNMSLVFAITIFIENDVQLRQALRCIKSVREFHTEHIFLLNETEGKYFETIRHHFTCFENLTIFSNHRKGLGEQQVFYFILDFCMVCCLCDRI